MTPEQVQEVHERTTSERTSAKEKLNKYGVGVHDYVQYYHDLCGQTKRLPYLSSDCGIAYD